MAHGNMPGSRASKACANCRAIKSKCFPADRPGSEDCARCIRQDLKCVYLDRKARTRTKPKSDSRSGRRVTIPGAAIGTTSTGGVSSRSRASGCRRLDDEVPFDRSEMDVASDTDARDQGEVNGNAGS